MIVFVILEGVLRNSYQLEHVKTQNMELKHRLVESEEARRGSNIELQQLKYKVDYLEQRLIDKPFPVEPYRRPWPVSQPSILASVSGMLPVIG